MGQKRYRLMPYRVGSQVKHVTLADGLELMDKGSVAAVFDSEGELLQFQYKTPAKTQPYVRCTASSEPSRAGITSGEMGLIAYQKFSDGRSRTLGLDSRQRDERIRLGLRPEDNVELALAKLEAFRPVKAARR